MKAGWKKLAGGGRPLLLLAAGLALIFLVYRPGLIGGFLFDDYANLPALGDQGGIRDWRSALIFILSGISSDLGRPLSMASFLLDAHDWPASAFPFKLHNLFLHLLATALLAAVGLGLGRELAFDPVRRRSTAVLAALAWGLHPFWVSTVLYPVQRMTILCAIFVLAGLATHLAWRERCRRLGITAGTAALQLTAIAGIFTILAMLSKENGALLPTLIGGLELILIQRKSDSPTLLWWGRCMVTLPLLVFAVYFFSQMGSWYPDGLSARGFTVSERLLTECRVTFAYWYRLFIPRMQTAGLFQDDFSISTNLVSPPTTLAALFGLLAVAGLAWFWRRRFPIVAAAAAFYFLASLLESTIPPLEIYFEHRNYLPATLAFYAASAGITGLPMPARRWALAGATLLAASLAALTWLNASLWANTDLLFRTWSQISPQSQRAQAQAILVDVANRQAPTGKELPQAPATQESNLYPVTFTIGVRCITAQPRDAAEIQAFQDAYSQGGYSTAVFRNLDMILGLLEDHRCDQTLRPSDLILALNRLILSPAIQMNSGSHGQLLYLRSRLDALEHLDMQFDKDLREAFRLTPGYDAGMTYAAVAATRGDFELALEILHDVRAQVTEELAHWPRNRRGLVLRLRRPLFEIESLQKQIEHDQLMMSSGGSRHSEGAH